MGRIVEFTVRAALARSRDDSDWEHDEFRRGGVACLQLFRNGKAIWNDREMFNTELGEVCREHAQKRFEKLNELDPELYVQLERDVRARWLRIGYRVPNLMLSMKELYNELERDFTDRATRAMERLLKEILGANAAP